MPTEDSTTGRFLVTEGGDSSAVLSSVETGRVHPLAANPGLDVGDVVEATLATADALGVTWRVAEEVERWHPAIAAATEPPGERARSLAADLAAGEISRAEFDGVRLHVVAVAPERTGAAVTDVVEDETTRRVAARLGARRVDVRGEDGVVAVRYVVDDAADDQ